MPSPCCVSWPALFIFLAEYFWLGVQHDQRHANVHQQCGERRAVRESAKGTDQIRDQARTRRKDQAALVGGGTADRIGEYEERAQHRRTGEPVEQRRHIVAGIKQMKNAGDDEQGAKIGDGDVRSDDAVYYTHLKMATNRE